MDKLHSKGALLQPPGMLWFALAATWACMWGPVFMGSATPLRLWVRAHRMSRDIMVP